MKYHVGAGRVRTAIQTIEDPEIAVMMLRALFPGMSERIAKLIVRFPGETSCSGPYIAIPDSWGEI